MANDQLKWLTGSLLLSAVLFCLLLFALSRVQFQPALTEREKTIIFFSYENMKMAEREPLPQKDLESPIDTSLREAVKYPSESLQAVAPAGQSKAAIGNEARVTLIMVKGEKRYAIVDNVLVQEGDTTDRGRIERITKEGVFIKAKEGQKWIKLQLSEG